MRLDPEVAMSEFQTIERAQLMDVTGGLKRVAHPRGGTGAQTIIATLQAFAMQIQQQLAARQDPLTQILPVLVAMRGGDTKGAIEALAKGSAPAAAPADAKPTATA